MHFVTPHLQLFTSLLYVKMPVSSLEMNGSEDWNFTLFNLLFIVYFIFCFSLFYFQLKCAFVALIMLHFHIFCIYKEQESRNH